MNEMLSKIYHSDYFVIGLFIVIVILAIIFLVLVFSGKKKKNKEKEEIKVNNNTNNTLEQNLATIDSATVESPNPTPVTSPVEPVNPVLAEPIPNPVEPQPIVEGGNQVENVSMPVNMGVMPQPVENPVTEVPSEPDSAFNTSIFHNMPETIANTVQEEPVVSVGEISPEVNNTSEDNNISTENPLTSNLFEPAPDLSQVSVNNPLNTEEEVPKVEIPEERPTNDIPNINEIMPNYNGQSDNISAEPISKSEPELNDYQKERIQMPNQFSSVYINKEEPVEEKKENPEPKSDKPPYDPTLFNTIYDPVPDIKPAMPEENKQPEITPIVENNGDNIPSSTPSFEVPEVNIPEPTINSVELANVEPVNVEPTPFEMPKFDTIPPLEPINNVENNDIDLEQTSTDIKINPQNTFEMPNLATPQTDNASNNDETTDATSVLPNFNNETFNINK